MKFTEKSRRAFPIFPAVDGSVYHPDGVNSHLNRVVYGEFQLTAEHPAFAIGATVAGELIPE